MQHSSSKPEPQPPRYIIFEAICRILQSCHRQFARPIIREFFRPVCRAEPLTPDERERKALQLLDMMDAWLARRKADAEPTPLVYDPGEPGDLNPEGKSTEAEAVALFQPGGLRNLLRKSRPSIGGVRGPRSSSRSGTPVPSRP